MKEEQNIVKSFEKYKQSIFTLENDIKWWKSFLNISIVDFAKNKQPETLMYESVFSVYNINPLNNVGYLKSHKSYASFSVGDLETRKESFFNWIINLAILKAYNSMEIFLLESIYLKYFNTQKVDFATKKFMTIINSNIKNSLSEKNIPIDTYNNQHLIKFLKSNSADFEKFASHLTRVKSTTTWDNFFIMFSILRNVIAHNGMILNQDSSNTIKSIAKDVFKSHFNLASNRELIPITDQFNNFLIFVNDFTINTVKIMFDHKDLKFLNLY